MLQRGSCLWACSMVWTTAAAQRMMRASFNLSSVYSSPCYLMHAVCCVLPWFLIKKTNHHISCERKTVVRVLHGTCEALRSQKGISWLSRDLEPPEHVPPTSARATVARSVHVGLCVPYNQEHDRSPTGGRAKYADVRETSIWYIVLLLKQEIVQYLTECKCVSCTSAFVSLPAACHFSCSPLRGTQGARSNTIAHVWALDEVRRTRFGGAKSRNNAGTTGRRSEHVKPSRPMQAHKHVQSPTGCACCQTSADRLHWMFPTSCSCSSGPRVRIQGF